jgi:hypothetical protein
LPRRNTVTGGFPGICEREQSFARRPAPHALKKQARRQGAITKIPELSHADDGRINGRSFP